MTNIPPGDDQGRLSVPRWALALAGGLAVVLVAGIAVGATLLITGNGDEESATPPPEDVAGGVGTGPTGPTGAEEAIDPRSCEAKGINPQEGNEGSCIQGKWHKVVVNKDSTLELDQLDARLKSIELHEEVSGGFQNPQAAKGIFVVATLQITNTTHTPQVFDSLGDSTSILLCGDLYNEDFKSRTERRPHHLCGEARRSGRDRQW